MWESLLGASGTKGKVVGVTMFGHIIPIPASREIGLERFKKPFLLFFLGEVGIPTTFL